MTATFRDIKDDILSRITCGDWKPGTLLPNEQDLSETYGCARATVNRAMRELAEDGIIERKRKAGTRVRLSPLRQARIDIPLVRREIEEQGASYRYALIRRTVLPAPDWLRARLGVAAEAEVLHLTCVHFADGLAYQFEDRWINLPVLPAAREVDFARVGPNEWLVATIPFSAVEVSFSASLADRRIAENLGCAAGDALFLAERSTWWQGEAVTYVRLHYQRGYRMTTRY